MFFSRNNIRRPASIRNRRISSRRRFYRPYSDICNSKSVHGRQSCLKPNVWPSGIIFFDLFCQICYTTREDMQNYRREENFILRTPLEYLVDVRNLAEFFEKLCWYICPSKKFCFLTPCKMPTWARSLLLSTRTSE